MRTDLAPGSSRPKAFQFPTESQPWAQRHVASIERCVFIVLRNSDSFRDLDTSIFLLSFSHFYFPASGQAVVTGVVPSPPRFLPSNFIAHRVQQSHCSSIFHRVLLTHALALSASQFVRKKKSQRMYNTSMHSAGLELTKLTYTTRLEDNLIRHRGDRPSQWWLLASQSADDMAPIRVAGFGYTEQKPWLLIGGQTPQIEFRFST